MASLLDRVLDIDFVVYMLKYILWSAVSDSHSTRTDAGEGVASTVTSLRSVPAAQPTACHVMQAAPQPHQTTPAGLSTWITIQH